jgi:hypothetical protein
MHGQRRLRDGAAKNFLRVRRVAVSYFFRLSLPCSKIQTFYFCILGYVNLGMDLLFLGILLRLSAVANNIPL